MEAGRQVSDLAEAKTIPVGFKTGGADQGLRGRGKAPESAAQRGKGRP